MLSTPRILSLALLVALGCGDDGGGLPASSEAAISSYGEIVHASYADSLAEAQAMDAALDAFGTKVRTMPAEALLHAEDDALDAIRLAVESRGDAEAEGSGS